MRGRLPGSVVDAQVRYSREMAEQTTSSIVVNAEPAAVMAEGADGWADQVFFVLDVSPIRDEYTLAYEWKGDEQVTWSLVSGKMLRSLDGAYVLRDLGDGSTEVTYRLALDVSIPLIGMLKRKGEKILIDTALKGLKKRVESL